MIRKSRYMQLIEMFPLRPIRSEAELARAARIAGRLAVAVSTLAVAGIAGH